VAKPGSFPTLPGTSVPAVPGLPAAMYGPGAPGAKSTSYGEQMIGGMKAFSQSLLGQVSSGGGNYGRKTLLGQ
jgi:hypothetical protein